MGRKPKNKQSYIKNTVDKVFGKYIRLRDALKTTGTTTHCKCITCNKVKSFDQFDAGHWMRRKHMATRFDERNVHAQCKYCNKWRSGEQSKFERALNEMYGRKEVDKIFLKAQEIKQFKIKELQEIVRKYRQKTKELEKEK